MSMIVHWAVVAATLLAIPYLVSGFQVAGIGTALVAAAVLGFVNLFFKPILIFLTLPINILTLGLFTFIINALMLKMAAGLVSGFEIKGLWPAIFGGLILSLVNMLLSGLWEPSSTTTT